MAWLFARHLRPFVLLAGAASLALNLALLAPAMHTTRLMDTTELYSKLTAALAAAVVVLITLLL